jgi:hypothetical protein
VIHPSACFTSGCLPTARLQRSKFKAPPPNPPARIPFPVTALPSVPLAALQSSHNPPAQKFTHFTLAGVGSLVTFRRVRGKARGGECGRSEISSTDCSEKLSHFWGPFLPPSFGDD